MSFPLCLLSESWALPPPWKHPEDRAAEHPLLEGLLVISGMMSLGHSDTVKWTLAIFSIDGWAILPPQPPPISKPCLTRQVLPLPVLDLVGWGRIDKSCSESALMPIHG